MKKRQEANFVNVYINQDNKLTSAPHSFVKDEAGVDKMVDHRPALDEQGRQKVAPLNRRARRTMSSNKWKGPKL